MILSPKVVAGAFVGQYYMILKKNAENMHNFYQESSWLGWPALDGEETPVTTRTRIHEKIMSSDFRNCSVEVKDVTAQGSPDGGVVVVVTGLSRVKNSRRNFHQTFFLAKQDGGGFFVSNDILKLDRDDKQDLPVSSMSNAVSSTVTQTPTSYAKAVVEDENVKIEKEVVDLTVPNDTDTEVTRVPSPVPDTEDEALIDWEIIL